MRSRPLWKARIQWLPRPLLILALVIGVTGVGVLPSGIASGAPLADQVTGPRGEVAELEGFDLADLGEGEVFRYRWRFTSFLGRLAGLFLPGRGDGVLSFKPQPEGALESRLEITSDEADSDEYWLYAALMDPGTGRTTKAWSDYRYRGKEKRRESEIDESGVVDIASAIYRIRRRPPASPLRLKIWSDGKIYPVEVIPGPTRRFPWGQEDRVARSYRVVGVEEAGSRFWKGRLNLWISLDPQATPLVIEVERSALTVRLEMVPPPVEENSAGDRG
ncbi:MAG: DUF3108 domain-containing protein [Acidobacteriota bacterium]